MNHLVADPDNVHTVWIEILWDLKLSKYQRIAEVVSLFLSMSKITITRPKLTMCRSPPQ